MDRETAYKMYIIDHKNNVKKAFNEYGLFLSRELEVPLSELTELVDNHDLSKFEDEEFYGYLHHFYPDDNDEVYKDEFDMAWSHHIHNNPHHPEYWVLYNFNDNIIKVFNMDNKYIAEMILDWIAMGYSKNNKAYDYYEKNKDKYLFKNSTRFKVEYLLDKIKEIDNNNLK